MKNSEDSIKKRKEAFRNAKKANEKSYSAMTPKEKILYNLSGISQELAYKGINSTCHCHKVHCIDCAISEIKNNLDLLLEKP